MFRMILIHSMLKLSREPFMRVQVVFMRMHTHFLRMHLCLSFNYGRLPQHAHVCRTLRTHTRDLRMHVNVQKPHLLFLFLFFFPYLFSLTNHDSYAPFHLLLQVLPPFISTGSASLISSWYRVLTKDTMALVHMAGFEPVIHLLLKGSASGILVQTLYERWWDTTYTFHIAEREITVTSHDFHWMMGFSDDADEAKPSHRLLSSSISLPSTHTHRLSLLHHKILFPFLPLSPYHPHTHSFFLTIPIPIPIPILLGKLFI